jgi:TonB family protein
MNPLLIYIIKSSFCLAMFYLVYRTLLSKDTLYGRNRAFILFSMIMSLALPFVTIETKNPIGLFFFGKTFSEVLITASSVGHMTTGNGLNFPGWPKMIFIIYIAGLLLFSARLIINMTELVFLILGRKSSGTNIIRFRGLNTAGFSAIGYVFVNSGLSETDAEEVLRHERNHLDHHHFLDIIFIEFVKILQWFNPFIHLFDRSLRAVHEYQADEGCLRNGVPVFSYQQLLMNQVFRSNAFGITNSFSNPTLIKNRMIMMTKKRSSTLANLKILMVLPVIAIVIIAFSSCKGKTKSAESATTEVAPPPPPPPPPVAADAADKKVESGQPVPADAPPPPPPPPPFTVNGVDTTWITVQEMPVFKGGDAGLLKFVAQKTTYPEGAKLKGIQGKVIVRFCVTRTGEVNQVSVLKGVDAALDAEAIRVVSSLPKFEKPGYQHGKPVGVWYMLPITFALN